MPQSTVRSFADPWEFQEAITGFGLNILLTTPGEFRAELTRVDMERLWLQRGGTSLPRVTHSVIRKDRSTIFFLTDGDQAPIHHDGIEIPPDVIMAKSSGADHHCRATTETRWGSMSLTPEDLAAAGRNLVGYDLTAPAVTRMIRPQPTLMSRLLHLHQIAGRLAATAPAVLAHLKVNRAIEEELVRLMVQCLTQAIAVETDSQPRVPVMRRFEEYIREHSDGPIYITEICAAIGVSDRTLRLHCQEHLRISPHEYLWLRRMHLARRALAVADPAAATVTSIALDQGFGELGRFAVAYRKLFGESPSITLRRSAIAGRSERGFQL